MHSSAHQNPRRPSEVGTGLAAIWLRRTLAAIVGFVLISPEAFSGDFVVFGPERFVLKGAPVTVTRHFSVLDPQIPYVLRIKNAGVTADLTLNGTKILARPKDSNSGVVARPVTLLAENQLTLELRGPRGSHLTLQITGTDSVPPTITAIVTPTPNEAGWNNSDVTVSFSCDDATSGIESCPAPVTLSSEGSGQLVKGVARDRAGNTAEASVTINIDKTPPQLAITSPSPGAVVDTPSLTVTGTVSDALSGITSVTCNGTPASVSTETFTCSVTLVSGSNTITVSATDVAGNSASAAIEVSLQELDDIPPEKLQEFLNKNGIDSAAKFLERLPLQYKQHWIMVTKQESAQKSSPTEPRLLLPSKDSSKVFSFCTGAPCKTGMNFIEYLQFEASSNTFLFNEIDFPDGKPAEVKVGADAGNCKPCHGNNPRPNWDAYDNWANMLPFNRDRIYQGSQEEEAFIRLLEHLQDDPIVSQLLEHLPEGEGVTFNNGRITITPDGCDDTFPPRSDAADCSRPERTVSYVEKGGLPIYGCNPTTDEACKGATIPTMPTTVTQGGNFLTLHHSRNATSDEGRGTALFDQFSGYNAQRVAQELLDHPRNPVDIRPIALAIAKGCDFVLKKSSSVERFKNLLQDTKVQRHSLPRLKANAQAENLKGLIDANNAFPPAPPDPFAGSILSNPENITKEIARRSLVDFEADTIPDTVPGLPTAPGTPTGFMIDREDYKEDETIALFRFFLEPNVQRWSMGVPARVATYTFADVFSGLISPPYRSEIRDKLRKALVAEGKEVTCDALETASKQALDAALALPSSVRLDLAVATTGIPLVSPQGPDLVIETIGCDAGTGLEFKAFNVGTESADGFRNKIVFISRATGQQVGYPTLPRPDEQALVLGPGEWTDLSVAVPKACFPEDVPFEQQGCDVLIFADGDGTVKEPDDENNMDRGLCAS